MKKSPRLAVRGRQSEAEQSLIVEGDKASMEVLGSAGWRRKRSKSCRRQNRDRCTYHDFRFPADGAADAAPAGRRREELAAPAAATPAAAVVKDVHVPDIGSDEVEVTEVMVSGDTVEANSR